MTAALPIHLENKITRPRVKERERCILVFVFLCDFGGPIWCTVKMSSVVWKIEVVGGYKGFFLSLRS